MTFQSNRKYQRLVSMRDLGYINCAKFIFKKSELYIYLLENHFCIEEIKRVLCGESILYYLDCFVVLLPDDYQKQNLLWKNFYSVFAREYEQLVDVSNNLMCIERMITYINNVIHADHSSVILDYGCGIGLSALISFSGKIVGYDLVYSMRMQASKRGLQVVDDNELSALPDCFFDAVFSSYVFHMAVSESSIKKVLSKMKPGAIWVANYYKGINESVTNDFFLKNGFLIKKLENMQERFGNIYEYSKGRDGN